MGISVEEAVKEIQGRENIFVLYSQLTKLPYVTCGEETYNDQVWLFADEEKVKAFGKEKAKQLKAAASTSFGVSFAKQSFALQIRQLIEQLEFLEGQIEELEEQISLLLKQTESHITTIPGIGDTLGAIILGEIGDIHRFDAPNKLVAFAGLDVRVSQSGEFIGTRQKISKRGSPYLRRAIWLAASRAAFCDPILSEYYQSLRARGKHHLTAIGAVSRKLCNIIFAILSENRPYETVPPREIRQTSAPFTM